jgi:hypothetical protein
MNSVMVVMMIWVGSAHGGPAMIQGFETIRACEAAAQIVLERYPYVNYRFAKHTCVELPVR